MDALEYTQELVRFPTVSSVSNVPICNYLESVLRKLDFTIERLE